MSRSDTCQLESPLEKKRMYTFESTTVQVVSVANKVKLNDYFNDVFFKNSQMS